jgi:hypothetical protein
LQQHRHGADDWQVVDAWLDLQDVLRLAPKQRQRLRLAEQKNGQVVVLWQGRSAEALAWAQKAWLEGESCGGSGIDTALRRPAGERSPADW